MERIVQTRRNRETGTTIDVVDRGQDDPDVQGGDNRWETICTDHGTVCSHQTRAVAVSFAAVPTEWCEDCQAQYATDGKGSWNDYSADWAD